MVKPDGVQRGLIGETVTRFEAKGLKLVAARFESLPDPRVIEQYPGAYTETVLQFAEKIHHERPLFPDGLGRKERGKGRQDSDRVDEPCRCGTRDDQG